MHIFYQGAIISRAGHVNKYHYQGAVICRAGHVYIFTIKELSSAGQSMYKHIYYQGAIISRVGHVYTYILSRGYHQ